MFTRLIPIAGESIYEGIPKLVISGMFTAGLTVTQRVLEVYLTRHLNVPAIVGYPALKDIAGSIRHDRLGPFTNTVTFKRHHHELHEKQFLKIALPASTTVKHACSASYVFQPPSTKASMAGIILCVAVAIITASAIFLNSNRAGVSESGSSSSSTSTSSSDSLSAQGSSLQARRTMLVTGSGGSGGNDPARGRDLGRRSSSSRRHAPSPLRHTLATAESGSPPPPPPPNFPALAEDDDKHPEPASSFPVDWISVVLLIPILLQLKKIFLLRAQLSGTEDSRSVTTTDTGRTSDESFADTSSTKGSEDLTCVNTLPLPSPSSKVFPKPNPTTNDGTYACQNVLPLTTSRSSTMVSSQDHPTHLPALAAPDLSICGSKNVEATRAGRSLMFVSTLAYMVGAFVSPLIPLFLFRLAVRSFDVTEPTKQETDSVDDESSEEGEVYDILERPEVRPVEDQVLARIAMHFRPLRDDLMDSESESDGVLDTPVPFVTQTPTPRSDSPVNIVTQLPPTSNALNPQASTFVPKKSRVTHDERLARWKARRFPQPTPPLVPTPARIGESSSQIAQSTHHTANKSESLRHSSSSARTSGSSTQIITDSSSREGIETKRILTPNQKSSLRRKMRKKAKREEGSQGDIAVLDL